MTVDQQEQMDSQEPLAPWVQRGLMGSLGQQGTRVSLALTEPQEVRE